MRRCVYITNSSRSVENEDIISQLPEEWSADAATRAPENAAKYAQLQGRLQELTEKRRVAREKVEAYRHTVDLLRPFDAGYVQENLVAKNGEVEKELERMRMLMLRVERGIAGLERRDGEEDEEMEVDWEPEGEAKIEAILDWS